MIWSEVLIGMEIKQYEFLSFFELGKRIKEFDIIHNHMVSSNSSRAIYFHTFCDDFAQ